MESGGGKKAKSGVLCILCHRTPIQKSHFFKQRCRNVFYASQQKKGGVRQLWLSCGTCWRKWNGSAPKLYTTSGVLSPRCLGVFLWHQKATGQLQIVQFHQLGIIWMLRQELNCQIKTKLAPLSWNWVAGVKGRSWRNDYDFSMWIRSA